MRLRRAIFCLRSLPNLDRSPLRRDMLGVLFLLVVRLGIAVVVQIMLSVAIIQLAFMATNRSLDLGRDACRLRSALLPN